MKKARILSLVLSMLIILHLAPVQTWATETNKMDITISSGCRTIDGQVPLYGTEKKLDTAMAAFLYETGSGTVMYAWNPDQKLPPASLAKIMTCLLVLENCDTNEKVTVTKRMMQRISSIPSTLMLQLGEELTVDQLLHGLMVGSANDAAVVLAEYVAGSENVFVEMMNDRAKELGCVNTFYVNSHGLHDVSQVTTARDVARLLTYAMKSDLFMEYFGETSFQIPATEHSEIRELETTNYLMTAATSLYYDPRVTGGRTGITDDSRRSLAVTASDNGMDYVVVILSAKTVFNEDWTIKRFGNYEEAQQLLSLGFESHNIHQILYNGQILSQFNVLNGKNAVSVGPANATSVVLPSDTKLGDLTIRYGDIAGALQAPIESGQEITTVEVWYNSVCVGYSPVITLNGSAADRGSMLLQNRYGGGSKIWIVLGVIILIVAVLACAAFLLRRTVLSMRNIKTRKIYRNRRSDRRRAR